MNMENEYGKCLVEMGKRYPNLVALEADLQESTQSILFKKAYPDRYFEIGVAEQNMVDVAAGLALAGKIPVTHTFAIFNSMRACEQVRTSVAYPKLNVKFFVSHSGTSCGSAGTTHHAIEDIAIMRVIPNMTVLVPGDARELRQVVEAALAYDGPVYIRLGAGEAEDVYTDSMTFSIGKATQLCSGNDATIISTGSLMYEAVEAAGILSKDFGIQARVLQMASIKPIDREAIINAARETGCIVTIEDHNVIGGLGGAVCEVVAEAFPVRVHRIGVQDHFCDVGSADYLSKKEGLTTANIVQVVNQIVSL